MTIDQRVFTARSISVSRTCIAVQYQLKHRLFRSTQTYVFRPPIREDITPNFTQLLEGLTISGTFATECRTENKVAYVYTG